MTEEDQILRAGCAHILSGHKPQRPDQWLRALAAMPSAQRPADFYGAGGAVAELEARTAALLGKEAGLFVIKGVIAQLAVLKARAEQAGTGNVAVHPLSHIILDEGGAIERVAGLAPVRISRFAPFGVAEIEAVSDRLAAVVVELPLRRAGYLLPPLDELRGISAFCRARGIPLHFDGARIWEAAAGYGIGLAELAALADSVYVSFYKGLGAPGGALVAGDESFLRTLPAWKGRFGGNLFTAFPYALGGLAGLDTHLPRMGDYVARARALAAALGDALTVNPSPPQANAFQLLLPGAPAIWTARNRRFAEERGIWMFSGFGDAPIAGHSTGEIVIGDNSDGYTITEAARWTAEFVNRPSRFG
jgi:threonine aldolase